METLWFGDTAGGEGWRLLGVPACAPAQAGGTRLRRQLRHGDELSSVAWSRIHASFRRVDQRVGGGAESLPPGRAGQAAPAAKTAAAPRTERPLLSLSAFILFDA